MSTQGNLQDNNAVHLFNAINMARQSGNLTLFRKNQSDDGSVTAIQLNFSEGRCCGVSINGREVSFVKALYDDGKLNSTQFARFIERAQNVPEKVVALKLIEGNYATREEIIAAKQKQIQTVVRHIMKWDGGMYQFDASDDVCSQRIVVDINYNDLARQTQEIEVLTGYLPSLDKNIVLTKDYRRKVRGAELSETAWKVIAYVSSNNSLHQMARELKLSGMEIRKVLYKLEKMGVVEIRSKETHSRHAIQNFARSRATRTQEITTV